MAFISQKSPDPEMTFEEALEHIKNDIFTAPGPFALSQMQGHLKRTFNLSDLKAPPDRFCKWCNATQIAGRKKLYCSDNCKHSAFMYTNPQSPQSKMYTLIRTQHCACAICGLSYEDLVIKKVKHYIKRKAEWEAAAKRYGWTGTFEISYYHIGDNTGHLVQVDHRIPIFKGGDTIGLDNIQVVCAECHLQKTAAERKV